MTAVSAKGGTRILERPGQGATLMVTPAELSVSRGPDRGQGVTVEGRPVRVGTTPACDLVLTDPAVSAVHLTLTPRPEGFLLEDAGSTNGTVVEGYRVTGLYLPRSATICLGDSRLRFAVGKDEVSIPLSSRTAFGELLGHSEPMRQVFAILERVADSDTTVLVEGESGTGKELAARALHRASSRADGPLVTVDCGALPDQLIESELFGHARGAFTGASEARPGLFEEADGGTLLLDEVGELPLELQPKLLRVLETREVRRVGEGQSRPVDVRVVAATNRNLAHEVAGGRFREDLYFRLSVIRVRMPPLRERQDEIARLAAHFAGQLGQDPAEGLPPEITDMLLQYPWPGNVRELRNVVERLVRLPGMAPDFYLEGTDAAPTESEAGAGPDQAGAMPLDLPFHEGKQRWVERFERAYLSRLLQRCKGNISEVARVSGLSRQSCHRLLARHRLQP